VHDHVDPFDAVIYIHKAARLMSIAPNLDFVTAALSDPAYVKKIAKLNEDDRQEFFNQVNARMLRCLDSQTNFVLLRTATTGKEL